MQTSAKSVLLHRIFPFLSWWPEVNKSTLRADLIAGLTGAVIVLPQGVAFAMIAGLALIGNAIIVTLKNGPRDGIVTIGIVVVVGLDLALILALSGPFNGPFEVGVDPLTGLLQEIRSGEYLPWSGAR